MLSFFCINEVIMLYNSALDHSIAHHKITCTRLLCTWRTSEYRESHTKEEVADIRNRYSK